MYRQGILSCSLAILLGLGFLESRLRGGPASISPPGQMVQLLPPLEGPAEEKPQPVKPAPLPELSLIQAIQMAFASNPDLRSARERVEIADSLLAGARAEFYPRLSIGENFGVTNNPAGAFMFLLNQARFSLNRNFNHPGYIDNFQTQVLFQHGLYMGGSRLAKQEAASAQRDAETFALAALQNELVFRVAEAYFRLLQARGLTEVREQAVDQVRGHLKIVQARARAEAALKSDVLSVQVRLAEVQESLVTARNQHKLAWAVLENVIGARLPPWALPREVPEAPWSGHIQEVETAVADALKSRPEVGEMNSRRLAAQNEIDAARAARKPMVDMFTDYSVYTPNFAQGNDSLFVGLAARLNLFDGGRARNNIRQAQARLRELIARQQRQLLDIELDVRRAYLQLADARGRLQVITRAVNQAAENLRVLEVRYKGKTAIITQLIDAQVAFSNMLVRRANAEAEVEIARASLERSVGRMKRFLEPQP